MLRRTHALLSSLRGHRAVVLTGPTAIGKTDLSLRLAEELNGEIVSADSVQSLFIFADVWSLFIFLAIWFTSDL
eukprot:m.79360 g.79360  ORF g.79360 m.79360 type:complete len:74 (+) comp14154_c0_seq3:199-420(+)